MHQHLRGTLALSGASPPTQKDAGHSALPDGVELGIHLPQDSLLALLIGFFLLLKSMFGNRIFQRITAYCSKWQAGASWAKSSCDGGNFSILRNIIKETHCTIQPSVVELRLNDRRRVTRKGSLTPVNKLLVPSLHRNPPNCRFPAHFRASKFCENKNIAKQRSV